MTAGLGETTALSTGTPDPHEYSSHKLLAAHKLREMHWSWAPGGMGWGGDGRKRLFRAPATVGVTPHGVEDVSCPRAVAVEFVVSGTVMACVCRRQEERCRQRTPRTSIIPLNLSARARSTGCAQQRYDRVETLPSILALASVFP